ncbi:DUF3800 domain-containing protein [Erythrobacter sp. 3-20A1M]|uniref:DUF3800 domain-containing protein n=1 Tax=Erythrobacter sp. 3-20A1M TaxID=2653850 RepID=UPI001BFC93C1|nr:DUF3800 domain-containing protein [Erythrobacter sp. 3-20A1M]QWC56940.1 DUF3800 domain-containing protein [Erythrobacter sp. 3-20A1M]
MSSEQKECGYIAYIDEAGDPGLKTVRPIDPNGASEWLVLSAVVMKAECEPVVIDWVRELVDDLGISQRRDLHYRTLSPTRKRVAGERIASLPLRGFAVCSNKKNMRGYRNPRAEKIPSQQWFYNFCVRLLLERVTAFCDRRTIDDYGERRKIKIEFSERGGHRYSQTSAYHYYLRQQQQAGALYLTKRAPVTDLLDWQMMEAHPHGDRAGLQLADFVASSFYQAIDTGGSSNWNLEPALALAPVMAREGRSQKDFGVALFPSRWWEAKLSKEQQQIFRHYGYEFARW